MKKLVLTLILALVFSSLANAQSIPKLNVFNGGNKWRITFYDDSSSTHTQWGQQDICFLPYSPNGTSIQGAWYSTTYPNWNGRYYQEGDEVKMTGDYANDRGHDHMTLQHTTNKMAFKDWTEWIEDGRVGLIIGWGNATMERIGSCHPTYLSPIAMQAFQALNGNADAATDSKIINEIESKAIELSQSLKYRLTVKGDIAYAPGQPDLESIDNYYKRVGQ